MDKKVDIIKDADGKSIVVINDLRFKGRRSVNWNVVEECLKEYIGQCAEILYDILRTKKKRASRLSNSCTVEKLISFYGSYFKCIRKFCQV